MQKDLEVTMSQVQRRSVARSVIELWEVLAKGIGSAWHAGKLRPLGISRWSAGSQGNVYEVKCLGREFLISMQIVQSSAEKLYAAVRVSETKSEAVGYEATPLSITAFIQDDGGLIGEDGAVITAALSQNPMTAAEIFCRLISDRVISTIPQGGPRFNPG